jgi:hypothetical protein
MPIDDLVEVGVRLAVEGAASGIHIMGDGRNRSAAVARISVRAAGLVICAAVLWFLIGAGNLRDVTVPTGMAALVVGGIGAWLGIALAVDVRLLRYWGEPIVSAARTGLKIPGHGVIAWHNLMAVEPMVRRGKPVVRITVSGRRGRTLYITSAAPHALAKAVLASKAERGMLK